MLQGSATRQCKEAKHGEAKRDNDMLSCGGRSATYFSLILGFNTALAPEEPLEPGM